MKITLLFILYYYLMNFNPNYRKFEPFTSKSLGELESKFQELHLDIPISKDLDVLRQNIKVENLVIPNRLSIQPMEGFDANEDGSPGELTLRRYKRYTDGGAGLIWFEATSIAEDCRSNLHQLMLTEENLYKFKKLTSLIRKNCNKTLKSMGFEDKSVLIVQLNHSGRYSKKNGEKFPIRAYHNQELDSAINVNEKDGILISDDQLKKIEDLWVKKVILANHAGFDGVDIKACHGYLISELLTSRARKNSIFGGLSLENRSKLFLNIVKRIKEELKNESDFLITTRLGVYDGIPYPNGFGIKQEEHQNFPASIDLSEPLTLINEIHKLGVKLINISAGNPHYKPYITRPYDSPIKGAKLPEEHPLYSVNRIINLTSFIKCEVPKDMIIIGSGYSYLRQYAGYIAAGLVQEKKVDICGFGRMAIANPTFPKQIFQEGMIDKKQVCITCSKCSELMKEGKSTGCVVRDPKYK
jgi:2,4-dienoyl-CoA reductase (NADPH2)